MQEVESATANIDRPSSNINNINRDNVILFDVYIWYNFCERNTQMARQVGYITDLYCIICNSTFNTNFSFE